MQNADAGMTKETYYEMCEQMGTNPEDGEVPISYDELLTQTQKSLLLFEHCQDRWDSNNGSYLGKDLNNIEFLLNLLDVDKSSWLDTINMLNITINYRVTSVNKKIRSKAKRKGK